MYRKRSFATGGQGRLPLRAAACRIQCLILCLADVERKSMARRPVLTSRQRSAPFSLPPREVDRRRHDTLSDDELQHIGARRRPRNKLGFALQPCVPTRAIPATVH